MIHVEQSLGSRQDIVVEVAGEVYWNQPYYIEFLDERIQLQGDNIFQENLLVILSLLEMVTLTHL